MQFRIAGLAPIVRATLLMALAACGDGNVTGAEEGEGVLALVPVDAAVNTGQLTSAKIYGTSFGRTTYGGTLGTVTIVAGRVNDSTVSFIVPAVAAGTQTLSITVGRSVVRAPIQVSVAPAVSDPTAYISRLDSLFSAPLRSTLVSLANTSSRTAADSIAVAADVQVALTARAAAQAAVAALSPADRQEVANLLGATFGGLAVAPRIDGASRVSVSTRAADALCDDPDIPKTVEETRACQRAKLSTLEQIKEKAEDCRAAEAEASGIRATLRTAIIQLVNFCHAARLAEFSATQWEAADFIVTPVFPTSLDELFTPITEPFDEEELRIGTPGSALSARVVNADAPPMTFGHGITRTITPRVRFRRLVGSDVGRIPAANDAASVLNSLAAVWRALNTYADGLLDRAPVTLVAMTNTRSRALRYRAETSLRLGRVQPQAIRWNWRATTTGIDLRFDVDDKSADVPFTYDLIYDGGSYGADTVTINAVLTRDSTPIYTAAALGRWTVTSTGTSPTTYQFEMKPNGIATYRAPAPDAASCSLFSDRYKDGACEFDVKWRVFYQNGRYYVEEFGFWNGYRGVPTPATFPLTGYDMVLDGTVNLRYRKN